jgi:hypothetical protein
MINNEKLGSWKLSFRGVTRMESPALPLGEQLALFVLMPPIGSCLWWLFSRGTAMALQGGQVSDRTKSREKIGFFIVLSGAHVRYKNLFTFCKVSPPVRDQINGVLGNWLFMARGREQVGYPLGFPFSNRTSRDVDVW